MATVATFEKIFTIRQTEKDLALKEYQLAVDQFEIVATQLYNLLKEKELMEEQFQKQLKKSVAVYEIQQYETYINQLIEKINLHQQYVQQARLNMEEKQQKLSDSYVEMKKIEKIIEKKQQAIKEKLDKLEGELLDEASLQQFLRNGRR
jgi:flagellar protein FliJ